METGSNGATTTTTAPASNGAAPAAGLDQSPGAASTALAELLRSVDEQLLRPDDGEFVGRDFVHDEIKLFLEVQNRMLVLVGSPGVGKTALAAQLVREQIGSPDPYLAHFCGLSGDDNPFRFCSALAQQLYDRLGQDYTLPQTVRNQQVTIQASANVGQASGATSIKVLTLNVGGMHPREAFRQLVREPLRAYNEQHGAARNGRQLVIVIDGMERAWEWDGGQDGNIVSVLADVQDLPPWVNFICTARSGPAVQALRAHAGVRVVDLQGAQNLKDIETFFRTRFLDQLSEDARGYLGLLLANAGLDSSRDGGNHVDAFVRRAVDASQGNFLFVRRYVDAWRATFQSDGGQRKIDPATTLLRFDDGTLAATLDTTYAAIYAQVRRDMDAEKSDADVLAALAIAFAPLDLALLTTLTRLPADAILQSLDGVLKQVVRSQGDGDPSISSGQALRTYAFFHRGFGEFVRRQLNRGGRDWDVQAAQALEQASDDDPLLRDYSARFRWSHLLRGLDLAAAARETTDERRGARGERPNDAPRATGLSPLTAPLDTVGQAQDQVHDPVAQAQLLRGLAARALDPAQSDAVGSWTAAINSLKTAEHTLRRSRALAYMRRRGWRAIAGGPVSNELIELDRTLVALGDSYSTIARRMDAGGQQPTRPPGLLGTLHMIWGTIARLPLGIYLLLVLLFQRAGEIRVPGAIQNLGRAQDWTVARLCVLSVSAYRRARSLARARGDDDSADAVTERLARLYTLMGAYDAAAADYEALLARSTTIARPWRQAVWRLNLGEVRVLQEQPDQAVETLNSALPTFIGQQAPVLQARALSALAVAHRQRADAAEVHGDDQLAATLDDQTIASSREALTAWADVTTLQGDESASVDPALAVSNVAHQLWRTTRSRRLDDQQRRGVRALLDTIAERHYPQRFEHPLLRLFRLSAAALLPTYLLFGLLLAVQLPSTVQVRTHAELEFPPPLVDLTSYPNDLISGKAASLGSDTARALSPLNLTKLPNSSLNLQRRAAHLDSLGTTRALLLIMGFYLLSYTILGLAVITFSSPAQFQGRRPGRLVLNEDRLSWRGPASQGSLVDAIVWVRQDIRWAFRYVAQRVRKLFGRATAPAPAAAPPEQSLAFADIAGMVVVNRSLLGNLLRDFSYTLARPRRSDRRPVVVPGSIVHYEELCDELALRLTGPRQHFGVEIARSWTGLFFLLTLLYTLLLVALLPLARGPLSWPLPVVNYSLINLYIIAAPGLLIPLLWWFVTRPLGASSATTGGAIPLAVTAAIATALTAIVLAHQFDLTSFGLRPDLATPVLAAVILLALIINTPPRPLRRMFSRDLRAFSRTLVTLVALIGLALVAWNIVATLRWYNALVQGNRLVEQAIAPGGCAAGDAPCEPLAQAIDHYTRAICLQPGDSEGYALRGFARLAQRDYEQSRLDFVRALGEEQPDRSCPTHAIPQPSESQRRSLHANIAAVDALLAHQQDYSAADSRYRNALLNYALALSLPADDPRSLECAPLAARLLRPDSPASAVTGVDLLATENLTIRSDHAPVALQLADACYSRGSARLAAIATQKPPMIEGAREAMRRSAWQDLAASIAEYRAVVASGDPDDRALARRGVAAGWLALSQIDQPPIGGPDRGTALLRAMSAYQELAGTLRDDPAIFAGQAWSSIQLGAWSSARAPLAEAARLRPGDPTYPALQGLTSWLDSMQYVPPRKGAPSLSYTAAISSALGLYSRVIELGQVDIARAYATRSVLYFSLRNSPHPLVGPARSETYHDQDYGAWMRLALADANQAVLEAEHAGLTPDQQVGYRYWRGRLAFTLALTWQEKSRGLHDWQELMPLYGSAYEDFSSDLALDRDPGRITIFRDTWVPWSQTLLANATHMQLAREAAERGEFAQARAELALVSPDPSPLRRWDERSAPLPDYHLLHGLISLGLGMPVDFPNPLLKRADGAPATSDAQASYDAAIAAIGPRPSAPPPSGRSIAPPPNLAAEDFRVAIYRLALADINRLLDKPPDAWPAAARDTAVTIRAKIQAQLDAIARAALALQSDRHR